MLREEDPGRIWIQNLYTDQNKQNAMCILSYQVKSKHVCWESKPFSQETAVLRAVVTLLPTT